MSPFRHHRLCLSVISALCAITAALMPAQFASAEFVDTIAPVLIVPANTTLPSPNPTYEQPVYVFNLASAAGEDGIVPGVGVTVNATDADSGNTNWTPTGQMGPFAPGTHTVTWKASDLGLNSDTETQIVTVLPHVNFAVDQTVGEGGTVIVTAYLNGNAPNVVTVPFTVTSNTNNAHTAVNSNITINAGASSGSYSFTITADGANPTTETIVFTMGAPTNAIKGNKDTHTVTLTDSNLPPAAELSASQGGVTRTVVATAAAGNVTVTPTVSDPNPGNTFTYNWSSSDASLVSAATNGTSNNTFSFNPTGLTPGYYTVKLTVTDNLGASSRRDLVLSVVAAAPSLSTTADSDDDDAKDNSDGYADSDNDGIPDYLDAVSASNMLQGKVLDEDYVSGLADSKTHSSDTLFINWTITTAASNKVFYPLLFRTDPGLKLSLGPLAFSKDLHHARISSTSAISALGVSPGNSLISADGSVIDVEIDRLSPGATVRLTIPQPGPIPPATGTPATTSFKLFNTSSNTWSDFSVAANDGVKSAGKTASYCPPPGHAAYAAGIAASKECVELTITDGGPNDSDGIVNGSIRVLGAVFISTSDTTTSTTVITTPGDISARSEPNYKNDAGSGGGGIGALWWEIIFLAPLLRQRKKSNAEAQRRGEEIKN